MSGREGEALARALEGGLPLTEVEELRIVVAVTRSQVARLSARNFGALSYIDKSIDNNATEGASVRWSNDDVMDMLSDIRRELTADVEIRTGSPSGGPEPLEGE